MKYCVNPNFNDGAESNLAPANFDSLLDLLEFHAESRLIGIGYVARKLAMSEADALLACAADGVEVEDVAERE